MGLMIEETTEQPRDLYEALRAYLGRISRALFPARVALMTDRERQLSPRVWEPRERIRIICLHCAGDAVTPRYTLMLDSKCAQCGGRSFINAAECRRVKRDEQI